MKKFLFTVVAIFQFCIANLMASPAYPYPLKFIQPDNTVITIILKGDECLKYAETMDGFTIIFNEEGFYEYAKKSDDGDLVCSGYKVSNPNERTEVVNKFLSTTEKKLTFSVKQLSYAKGLRQIMKSQSMEKAFPTTGNRSLICILMAFPDQAFTISQTDFNNLFNQINYNVDNATGSVKDFYLENSYNRLNLSVTVVGPYTADSLMAYYGKNNASDDDTNPRALITEAVKKADPNVNYANFDNDNNGSVDGVYVIYAGYGEEAGASEDAIWAHAWNISPSLTLDGKIVSKYSCSPELRSNTGTGITRIGVICHEFGHVLGAPDYYDTNGSTGEEFDGTGKWDLMANGSWNNNGITPAHHNGYTKTHIYRWASYKSISSPQSLTLKNTVQDSTCFYEYTTQTANEYYFCENRQKVGFDANIPGHGLIIYHVHKDIATGSINVTHPQKMYPVCASAETEPSSDPTSYGYINSGGCSFPGTSGKTFFSDATVPSSKSWAGVNTNKPLSNITEDIINNTVTFDFLGGASGNPLSFTASPESQTSIKLKWTCNQTYSNVMVAFNTSALFGTPVNGNSYAVGNAIAGGGTVIYKGTVDSFMHNSLTANTTYYYKIWSVKPGTEYSGGVTSNAKTYCGTISLPFTESFNNATLPNCWTIHEPTGMWTVSNTSNANGLPYELRCKYSSNTGTTRVVLPPINTTGASQLTLSFKHALDDYGAGATLKIQSSTDGINWTNEAWSLATSSNNLVGPELITTTIDNNLNSTSTFIAFAISGDFYQFDYWYIDDIGITAVSQNNWAGTLSNDWSTAGNWTQGIVPPDSAPVIIPGGCTFYPIINEKVVCKRINIQNGAILSITTGANVFVSDSIKVGQGASGIFNMNGGTCTIIGKLYTELGSTINFSGGTLNIGGWERNGNSTYSKGTINLTGGTITSAGRICFSGTGVVGTMSGNFVLNAGGEFQISGVCFNNVTGGTINLTGNSGAGPFFFGGPSAGVKAVAYHLNLNAASKMYYFCRQAETAGVTVKGNFSVLNGSIADLTNGDYAITNFDVLGNISIASGGTLDCDNTSDANINLAGNWSNSGKFYPGTNTVTLNGTNQTITGLTSFYNLSKNVTSAATLTFGLGASNKTTITNILNLSGVAGQRLSLRSATPGSQCQIDPQGNRVFSYLDVRDSYNTNAIAIFAGGTNSVTSGNNTNWNFETTPIDDLYGSGSSMFKLFPNPVGNSLYIICKEESKKSVTILGLDGKIWISQFINDKENTIDVSSLPTGTYLLKIADAKQIKTERIIKN